MTRGGPAQRARCSRRELFFLRYCDFDTIVVHISRATVPSLSAALGRPQSGEGRPMGSTHPPLESLLQFSQSCLEGFELSCLNRIATLRKEFREVLQESIELEIEARFARWVSEHRHLGTSFPNPTALPACVPVQLALRSVAYSSERLLLASGDELPVEFPFASLVELVDSAAFELRPPIRHSPVSHDASASLRSLEHCALCKARAIGDQPIDLLDFDATDSSPSCPFLPFPQFAPVHKMRNVSSQLTYVLAGTDQNRRNM